MNRNPAHVALAATGLMLVLACGGGGSSLLPPADGTAVFESDGAGLRMRGNLAFEDAGGSSVAGPSEGAAVFVGTGTRVAGTDPAGIYAVTGVPAGTNLRVRCFARGFMPLDFQLAPGTMQTDQMVLVADSNAADNPTIQNVEFVMANDGVLRFQATIPNGTLLSAFASPTLDPRTLNGAHGDALQVQLTPQGGGLLATGVIGDQMPTGSLHLFVAGTNGVADVKYGTCQLNLTDYRRAGRLVNGNITGPGGVACVGAEVLVFEEGNTANRGSANSVDEGRFGASLAEAPTGDVAVQVQWTDPATNITYVCLFRGNL